MTKISDRLRWKIANRFNRSPNYCWADLATWALGRYKDQPERRWPWQQKLSPGKYSCNGGKAFQQAGSCYCGKFRARMAEHPDGEPLT